jgi:hypothetical protein
MGLPSKYFNTIDVFNKDFFSYYKENYNEANRDYIGAYPRARRISTVFWEEVANQMAENEAGVIVDNLAYFCVTMGYNKSTYISLPKKGVKVTKDNFSFHSNHHPYHLSMHTNISVPDLLACWRMDRGFNNRLKDKISKNIKRGKRYLSFYSIVGRILKKTTKNNEYRGDYSRD